MTIDEKFISFGRYLISKRLEKGITIEQVSQETKIGVETLLFIEKEEHSQLPAEVFVKGFLRAYAKVVGGDGDKVVDSYIKSHDTFKAVQPGTKLKNVETDLKPSLMIILGLFLSLIILSFILL
jgi:cytoskeleton protein RodZ